MLSRAIAARAVPGDTPVKRKDKRKKKPEASSRAGKPGTRSSVELADDDVDAVNVSLTAGGEEAAGRVRF